MIFSRWRGTANGCNGFFPFFLFLALTFPDIGAAQDREVTPSDVYSVVEYSTRLADRILADKGITEMEVPVSRETEAKPMHVYELHVTVIREIYDYMVENDRRAPPQPVSTPISYTPGDVIKLSQMIREALEEEYNRLETSPTLRLEQFSGKTPADVYQKLFELYYKVCRLNHKVKISPNDVYSQIFRGREDMQYILLTLSKELNSMDEQKKRLLVTGIYGMGTDGTQLSPMEIGKTPADALAKALEVRDTLNKLRVRYELPQIARPTVEDFKTINSIDVFLQTQFIIAELNLMKQPLNIRSVTNAAKVVFGKTPSDVHQELKHLDYMLNRLLETL